jgi:hypothetical protein
MALLARGNRAGAERERRDFDELREKIPADASWGQNKARSVLEMASAILSARLAGAPKRSREDWERAVSLQDSFVHDEPPAWYYPIRESQGASLLQTGPLRRRLSFERA